MKLNNTISIVGLGKLGASMAVAIADQGFNVIGVDVNKIAIDNLNAGKSPIQETNIQEYIDRNKIRLSATTSHQDAVLQSDITFVIVPTPSEKNGSFSTKYVASAFESIGKAIKEKGEYHLVVLTSTVLPGETRKLISILEKESRKICGKDFGVCYSPEFIAIGSVIHDFLNPDFLLVGEFDKKSGDILEKYYRYIMENCAPCKRMSIENAELAKISLNFYVTMKITFANTIAELCEKLPGGDVDAISNAIGIDKRIGRKYLTGGLGFGGTCFPRDNIAFSYFAQSVGVNVEFAESIDRFNRSIPSRYVGVLSKIIKPGSVVAILGLSYKPNSSVVEESQSITLAQEFSKNNYKVIGYDPLANENARQVLGDDIEIKNSIQECISIADAVIITTQDKEFVDLKLQDFHNGKREIIVVDFWRSLKSVLSNQAGIRYIAVGNYNECM